MRAIRVGEREEEPRATRGPFSGPVFISTAEAFEVYRGLDIITAKVTEEERAMAPHHMLDVVDPLKNYSVIDFRNSALAVINDLLSRTKLPVVVGGTNYYIESLLWEILVQDPSGYEVGDLVCGNGNAKRLKLVDESLSNQELLEKLEEVDPEMAGRLHPNNRRKVIRSLEVFEQHGRRHSEILKEQRQAGGCGLGGPLRFRDSILLWLRCEQEVLDDRLDRRVDSMVKAGLLKELLDFHERYNRERMESNAAPDYTKGIFQSIGFKEFHDYLVLPEDERNGEKGKRLLQQGIEDLKIVTRRYARKQKKWVTNRLIRRQDRQVPPVYTLDCTDVDQWNGKVLEPAIAIVSARLRNETPSQSPVNENVKNVKANDSSNEEKHTCEICERTFIGELQWNAHLGGAKHKKMVQKKKELENS
ncbi:tRNA dimethylallyltransferase isoform X2 [Orussus abietinus]|uniref:tRNA dimethylallyltransferase isoform X2 n=1 Tax=Orussus abietinus TaxID=222816 RepID=UPI0006253875|nr:tRNA dimethylallyltransferase isoform X2 [Orussus abietinus]